MQLPELYAAISEAMQGSFTAELAATFARRAKELAALAVSATGPIDPTGQASEASVALEDKILALYEAEGTDTFAELHDSLLNLRSAITLHDGVSSPGTG